MAGSYHFYASTIAQIVNNGTGTAISSWTNSANQTFQLAVDVDNGKVWIGQNNVWWNSSGGSTGNPSTGANPTFTLSTSGFKVFTYIDSTTSINWQANFGQRPFAYTPPTGFKSLNTQNLPEPTIKKGNKYFDVALQTGNTTGRTVSGLGFQPDLVWLKNRAGSANRRWGLIDSVRGVNKTLSSNLTDAEVTSQSDLLTAFNSDGFTIGADAGFYGWNGYAESYVHFAWKESASAGFDIVTYTGDGTSARAISHSLGVAPKMVIAKLRSGAGENWNCWHTSLNNNAARLLLNTTGAVDTGSPSIWGTGGINPTSTTFQVGSSSGTNGNGSTYVAYLFAEVAGFSKFGSYTGNGSTDGPFVHLGFRPKFVMVKRTDAAGYSWTILDSVRDAYNVETNILYPNLSNAENTGSPRADFLSNGFKPRDSSNDNASGGTYIFAAFAENPFKNSLAR